MIPGLKIEQVHLRVVLIWKDETMSLVRKLQQ